MSWQRLVRTARRLLNQKMPYIQPFHDGRHENEEHLLITAGAIVFLRKRLLQELLFRHECRPRDQRHSEATSSKQDMAMKGAYVCLAGFRFIRGFCASVKAQADARPVVVVQLSSQMRL